MGIHPPQVIVSVASAANSGGGNMDPYARSRQERYISENAALLARTLASYCAEAAKKVRPTLGSGLPKQITEDMLFVFFLGLRTAIEAAAVKTRFGKKSYDELMAAMKVTYKGRLGPADFDDVFASAVSTYLKHDDPRDAIIAHSIWQLRTKEPGDRLFHMAIVECFATGLPISKLVELNT
jgi:hypothetical protein